MTERYLQQKTEPKPVIFKFGGTSTANGKLSGIVKEFKEDSQDFPLVVVSAIVGTTNRLIELCDEIEQGRTWESQYWDVWHSHDANALNSGLYAKPAPFLKDGKIQEDVYLGEALHDASVTLLTEIEAAKTEGMSPRRRAAIQTMGEIFSNRIQTAHLIDHGVPAVAVDAADILTTTDDFLNAKILWEPSKEKAKKVLDPLIAEDIVPVITGFRGATSDGQITELGGRGGSNYTATGLAVITDANLVKIYTDVDGIFTRDPNKYKDAVRHDEISFTDAINMGKDGHKIVHPGALEDVLDVIKDREFVVWVGNTNNPKGPGTLITKQ